VTATPVILPFDSVLRKDDADPFVWVYAKGLRPWRCAVPALTSPRRQVIAESRGRPVIGSAAKHSPGETSSGHRLIAEALAPVGQPIRP
jgi:hypothetical protein